MSPHVYMQISGTAHAKIKETLRNIGHLIDEPGFRDWLWGVSLENYAQMVRNQFAWQINWKPLARKTREKRLALYDYEAGWFNPDGTEIYPESPIYEREGFLYRGLTETDMGMTTGYIRTQGPPEIEYTPFEVGNYVNRWDQGSGTYLYGFGVVDFRFEHLQELRPILPDGGSKSNPLQGEWNVNFATFTNEVVFAEIVRRTKPNA